MVGVYKFDVPVLEEFIEKLLKIPGMSEALTTYPEEIREHFSQQPSEFLEGYLSSSLDMVTMLSTKTAQEEFADSSLHVGLLAELNCLVIEVAKILRHRRLSN